MRILIILNGKRFQNYCEKASMKVSELLKLEKALSTALKKFKIDLKALESLKFSTKKFKFFTSFLNVT